MCLYGFIKTLTLHCMQGCKKMITVCTYVLACANIHTLHTHDRHTHIGKLTLCGHKLMKWKCYNKSKKTMREHGLNYTVLEGSNAQLLRTKW